MMIGDILVIGTVRQVTASSVNKALFLVAAKWTGGIASTFSINAAGTNYVIGDTLRSTGQVEGCDDMLVTVTNVSAGAVTAYTVTNVGVGGFLPAETVAFANVAPQSGIGTGFVLNVDTVVPGNGSVIVTLDYKIRTLT
jgi:hypothetical protein